MLFTVQIKSNMYSVYHSYDVALTINDILLRVTLAGKYPGMFLLQDVGLSHIASGGLDSINIIKLSISCTH